jgi:hypothetical protein
MKMDEAQLREIVRKAMNESAPLLEQARIFREQIRAGEHEAWNQIVKNLLLSPKTPKMCIALPRQASLIVAFRQSNSNDWGLMGKAISNDQPLHTIALAYQAEVTGGGSAPITGELVVYPIGVVVIGPSDQGWADEIAFVPAHVDALAETLGRSREQELQLLNQFAFEVAEKAIQDLLAN